MKRTLAVAVSALAVVGSAYAAAKPARNVSATRHPNLAAAQRDCIAAFNKIDAAQKANEFDLGGHAAKAKELLQQVNDELKAAAEAANQNGH